MPALVRFRLTDGPHAGEPTTDRGEVERLARECQAADCQLGLDSSVVETRFNVVRSSAPETVTTARRLRDYLPPVDQGDSTVRGEKSLDEAVMTVGAWSRGGGAPRAWSPPRRSGLDVADRLSLSAPGHTALGGLPDGALGFGWGRASPDRDEPWSGIEAALREGVAEDASDHGPGRRSGHSQRSAVLPSP